MNEDTEGHQRIVFSPKIWHLLEENICGAVLGINIVSQVKDETTKKKRNIVNLRWLYFSPSVSTDLFVSSTILSIWMFGLKDMLSIGR